MPSYQNDASTCLSSRIIASPLIHGAEIASITWLIVSRSKVSPKLGVSGLLLLLPKLAVIT